MSDAETPVKADAAETAERRAPEAAPERLQAALDAPCVVRLATHKGRVVAMIPELGLIARAGSVEAAHAEVLRQREARIREFAAEDLLSELPRPGAEEQPEAGKRLLPQLRVFLIKAAVVAALFLGAVNIIGNGLRDVGYVLEKKLDSVAMWSPESVEKNRAKASLLAAKLGPLLRELAAAFERPENRPAQTPAAQDNSTAGAGNAQQ